MRCLRERFLRLGTACALVLVFAGAARAEEDTAITVSGGGVALFDSDVNGCFGAEFSNFSVGATIRTDGSVTGQWICMVKDCGGVQIAVIGMFTDVLDCSEDTVTLGGVAVLELQGGGIVDVFEFSVELRAGGPGVGGFTYTDPATPPGGDSETILQGRIQIQYH